MEQVSNLINEKLRAMTDVPTVDKSLLWSRDKAIAILLLYAVRREQGGQRDTVDAIFRAARASGLILGWYHIKTHITVLYDESSLPSLNYAIALMSPYIPWFPEPYPQNREQVTRWAAAVLAAPYSEDGCQSVVDMLLWLTHDDLLRSHIPVDIWAWLKRRSSLPPVCRGR